MKVLVACECSGRVRDAFARKGHNAWSCDLMPSEVAGQHLQCNVLDILGNGWDLMIGHPPCTDLATVGNAYAARKQFSRPHAIQFFMSLWNAPIPRICLENPIGVMSTHLRKPDQYLNLLRFGEAQQKKTGLWLKNLPPLKYPNPFDLPYIKEVDGKHIDFCYWVPGSKDQAKIRSRTFLNVAWAMAEQWG